LKQRRAADARQMHDSTTIAGKPSVSCAQQNVLRMEIEVVLAIWGWDRLFLYGGALQNSTALALHFSLLARCLLTTKPLLTSDVSLSLLLNAIQQITSFSLT